VHALVQDLLQVLLNFWRECGIELAVRVLLEKGEDLVVGEVLREVAQLVDGDTFVLEVG
jgi:hypothetical protein